MRGAEAWRKLEAEAPGLVLLDIVLPKLSGFDVLARMRKEPKLASVPVILLTNLGQRDDVLRGLELGADDYLIKAHFLPSEVVDKVKGLLQRGRKA